MFILIEDENETETKFKQRKPSFTKVELVKPNEQVKSSRELVKQEEQNKQAKHPRKNSQSPRGIVVGEGIPYERSPATFPRRLDPQRQVAGESLKLSLGKDVNVVVNGGVFIPPSIHKITKMPIQVPTYGDI
nr:hypothetical protein [Tanacetum cinerariifolium]